MTMLFSMLEPMAVVGRGVENVAVDTCKAPPVSFGPDRPLVYATQLA